MFLSFLFVILATSVPFVQGFLRRMSFPRYGNIYSKGGDVFPYPFFVPPVILVDMAVAILRYRLPMYWFTHLRSVGG